MRKATEADDHGVILGPQELSVVEVAHERQAELLVGEILAMFEGSRRKAGRSGGPGRPWPAAIAVRQPAGAARRKNRLAAFPPNVARELVEQQAQGERSLRRRGPAVSVPAACRLDGGLRTGARSPHREPRIAPKPA